MGKICTSSIDNISEIQSLRLFDDAFMNACFSEDIELAQFVLRIVMNKPTLTVRQVRTQRVLRNLYGRSLQLDIDANDTDGNLYDIEIQRDPRDANPKRARYHSSLLDANSIAPGTQFNNLHENYVIFFTETDYFQEGCPVYSIDRIINQSGKPFDDGSHILYVNGAYKGDSDIAKLIHDFHCTEPDDMFFDILANKARYFKTEEGGIRTMTGVMERLEQQAIHNYAIETAVRLLQRGTMSQEQIADTLDLPVSEIGELNRQLSLAQ